MVNLIADLSDARYGASAVDDALDRARREGFTLTNRARPDDRELAWIDEQFGGSWSSEANAGCMWSAHDPRDLAGFAAYDVRGLRFRWLEAWKSQPETGIFGPFGVAAGARGTGLGSALFIAALHAMRERGYRHALIPAVSGDRLVAYYQRLGASIAETVRLEPRRLRTVVLASGEGTNFQAVVDATARGELPLSISALIVNRGSAGALERARRAGIAARAVLWDRQVEGRERYDATVLDAVGSARPDLVLLLGWMHVLPAIFFERFPHVVNIHPAFLPLDPGADSVTVPDGSRIPAFRGPDAIGQAVASGCGWTGATAHLVTPEVDRGEVLVRRPFRLHAGEGSAQAHARLQPIEHAVLTAAVRRWSFELR